MDDPFLEFLIKDIKGGTVSPALRKVPMGEEVELHGPYGSFIIPPEKVGNCSFTFICTGTGIAPFHSFIRSYPYLDYQIIAGIRQLSERHDHEDYDSGRITFTVSREPWDGFNGRVTTYLENMSIDPTSYCYLCGNQSMIHAVYELLRRTVSGDHIFTEAFF